MYGEGICTNVETPKTCLLAETPGPHTCNPVATNALHPSHLRLTVPRSALPVVATHCLRACDLTLEKILK